MGDGAAHATPPGATGRWGRGPDAGATDRDGRPEVVPNPISLVDVPLFGLTGVLRRALLHVCVRAP